MEGTATRGSTPARDGTAAPSRAADALRASEARFRQLAEQARDVLWTVDLPSGSLSYLSPSFEQITGIQPEHVHSDFRVVLRRVPREDRRRIFAAVRDAARTPAGAYTVEYRIRTRDGGVRWIFDQGTIIRDATGQLTRLNAVARDITSRKEAELALAAERARFRDLFENSPDAIFVDSPGGTVLDVNQAACDLHRLPREQLVGRHVTELVPPEARHDVLIVFQRLAAGEQTLAEGLSLRSDGTSVPVELRARPVTLPGDRPAVLLHVRDISARRRAEGFLAGQKRILEWIATGRPVGDVLAELVRVTEARHHGIRCWVLWYPDDADASPSVLAPTFQPASVPLLAHLAATDGILSRKLSEGGNGPAIQLESLFHDPAGLRLRDTEGCAWESAWMVPVAAASGTRLGAFIALLEQPSPAAEGVLDLLRLAASLAGVAIERHLADASLRDGAARLRRANAALLELARSELVAKGDLVASLNEIAAAAVQGTGVARVSIWMFEENDSLLRCVSLFESGTVKDKTGLHIRVAEYPTYFEAITRDRLVSIADVQSDARTAELRTRYFQLAGIGATLDAGVRLHGRLVGIICLEHLGHRRVWKSEEELFAGSIADIIALAVQAGERRCIEEALRQSEEAYRSVVAALAEGVMVIHRDGTFATFNDSAADILGLTADYLQTHRLTDPGWNCLSPDGSPLAQEEYPGEATLRTGEPVTDAVMGVRRPDGRLVWLSVNTRPFGRDEAGQVTSVVVSFADITRRQEAERALREGHDLLQAVSDAQARFIADADPSRTFQLMLKRLVAMTHSDEGLIGEVVPAADGTRQVRLYPDPVPRGEEGPNSNRAAFEQLLDAVLAAAGPVVRTLPAFPDRQFLGIPLRHDEEIVGLVGLSRRGNGFDQGIIRRLDPLLITCANLIRAMRVDRQREQAEARIRQLNAELEQRVEERTADLRSTNEELAEFAYVVTHDLKAPLRGIHQLSEWLSQDHASRLDEEGLRLLGLLRGRVKHLQRMIDGLLACAKVARTPEPESSVSTLELVREVAAVLAPPHHVSIEAAPDLPVIWGNPDRLYQIFQNLLDNAVKYLDKPVGQIRVGAIRRRGTWEFRVSDNGPGIPERYQEKVFQIFQRLDPAGQVPGTGLGLTLVKRIVESRGGTIWIESAEGQGTSVCFTWPDRARKRAIA